MNYKFKLMNLLLILEITFNISALSNKQKTITIRPYSFWVTGSSGAGKSYIQNSMDKILLNDVYEVQDFDVFKGEGIFQATNNLEQKFKNDKYISVTKNGDKYIIKSKNKTQTLPHGDAIRHIRTIQWLKYAKEKFEKKGIIVIIFGRINIDEVKEYAKIYNIPNFLNIRFGLLDISKKAIEKRLKTRNWPQIHIEGNIKFAKEQKVKLVNEPGYIVVEGIDKNSNPIDSRLLAYKFVDWIVSRQNVSNK